MINAIRNYVLPPVSNTVTLPREPLTPTVHIPQSTVDRVAASCPDSKYFYGAGCALGVAASVVACGSVGAPPLVLKAAKALAWVALGACYGGCGSECLQPPPPPDAKTPPVPPSPSEPVSRAFFGAGCGCCGLAQVGNATLAVVSAPPAAGAAPLIATGLGLGSCIVGCYHAAQRPVQNDIRTV